MIDLKTEFLSMHDFTEHRRWPVVDLRSSHFVSAMLAFALSCLCMSVGCSADPAGCVDAAECTQGAICESGACVSADTNVGVDADALTFDADDGGADVPGCEGGAFGCPCLEGTDCASGYCVDTAEGLICTIGCSGECPHEDWTCRLVADVIQICLPPHEVLCRSCDASLACAGADNRCIALDDGNACGIICDDNGDCPMGFGCSQVVTYDRSAVVTQCVPDDGFCTGCADMDGDYHGQGSQCVGRDCNDQNADVYFDAPELCDGLDNDCDSDIDESFAFDTDVQNCGGCGVVCQAGDGFTARCQEGLCTESSCSASTDECDGNLDTECETDLTSNTNHCGACGVVCDAGATCDAGNCTTGECALGTGDCDGDADNGCETTTLYNTSHCGGCGVGCEPGDVCVEGSCIQSSCGTGVGDCNANPDDGCETDITSDNANCGGCGVICAVANGGAACVAGRCTIASCDEGFGDCDLSPTNGCEANIVVSVDDCGTCGTLCTSSNGTPVCESGTCGITDCLGTFRDCDGEDSTGCEIDTVDDVANCGACGNSCSFANASAACTGSSCVLGACNAGWSDCDGNATNGCEVGTNSSTSDCGSCGNTCGFAHATATCSAGGCAMGACSAGWSDCNGNPSDGCEVNTATAASDCGACGNACGFANAGASCSAGSCVIGACSAGYGNCDGSAGNGCEATLSSTSNCGTCGNSCGYSNAAASCNSGSCALGSCSGGYGNCDGSASNGCEAQLNSTTNCGSCGNRCSYSNASASCNSGSCALGSCSSGYGNCDGSASNGCEAQLNNTTNCGSCGNRCSFANAGATCSGGSCTMGSCTAGWANCDGSTANGCETNLNSATNCGGCGVTCDLNNASASCSGGSCSISSCSTGYANCDGVTSNGCEVNTNISTTNCGSCGNTCSYSHGIGLCSAGRCRLATCSGEWGNCDGNADNGCEANFNSDSTCGSCSLNCGFGRCCEPGICAGGAGQCP